MFKVAYFDIETTDLNPAIGRILAASVLDDHTGKVTTFRTDKFVKSGEASDMSDDKAVVVALRDELEKYHAIIGWYSKGFDSPFITSRLLAHNEKPMRPVLHLDAIWYAKGWRGMKANGSSLKAVARFLGVEESKMEVSEEVWAKARGGNKAAMDTICERCESDLRITRSVVERLADGGLIRNIGQYP